MVREAFDAQLSALQQDVLKMGSIAEEAIAGAVQSLQKQDLDLAQKVLAQDDKVDELDLEIEDHCLKLLALQSPLARDLRAIATVMRIATDVERLADLATNIAEVTLRIGRQPLVKPLEDIPRMAEMAQELVRESLDAFVARDTEKAREVCLRDAEVDRIYSELHDELMTFITGNREQRQVEQAANLLFVARYLERIADHATNIGERVIYLVTGKRERYSGRSRPSEPQTIEE